MSMVENKQYIAHKAEDGRVQLLSEHIKNVQKNVAMEGEKVDMKNLLSLAGIFHDAGKYRPLFQKHIQEENYDQINHSSVGARMIYNYETRKSGRSSLLAEMEAYVIAAHHGLFDCMNKEKENRFLQRLEETDEYQIAINHFYKELVQEKEIDEIYQNAMQELDYICQSIVSLNQEEKQSRIFHHTQDSTKVNSKLFYLGCLERLMLSMLIDSDWKDTNIFMENRPKQDGADIEIQYEDIFKKAYHSYEAYMNNLQKNHVSKTPKERKIIGLREKMRKECMEFAKKQLKQGSCYRLAIPTGGGKTLAGLGYALEYCKQNPKMKRIIYVSPFISVTEQNSKVIKEAVGNAEWVLEHHSGITEENGEKENKYLEKPFGETWEEPFIATTMCQFLLTLFSDKKQCIRRMHRLKNAVIIIDEVQSLPIKCIDTFNLMINFLTKVCHTTIILCTATQPLLANVEKPILYSKPEDLIQKPENREKDFSRVKILPINKLNTMRIQELADFTKEKMQEKDNVLIILNSKHTVHLLYEVLKQKFPCEYLTTNLCAEHRSNKIDKIKIKLESNDDSKLIVISTSLIEAGVDISFQCVIRALAGLDSIAQAAGRCNRHGELEKGEVFIVNVLDENLGQMPDILKGKQAARIVIGDYIRDAEGSLLDGKWMKNYYTEYFYKQMSEMRYITKEKIANKKINILQLLSQGYPVSDNDGKTILNQAFKTAGTEYHPIDNNGIAVLVPYGKGKKLIEDLRYEEDWSTIKELLHQLQRYTVTIYQYQQVQFYNKCILQKIEKGEYVFWTATEYDDEEGIMDKRPEMVV